MLKLKELSKKELMITGGHRLCPGCGAPIIVKEVLQAIDFPVVVGVSTGCLEVSTTLFPTTAWKVPFIHNAFENNAATISGVEAAYRALKRRKKINEEFKFIVFGGDGGTYDIGLQSLSGAVERGHNFLYVCYDNEAYMNTGIQRSSATPRGANTSTTPVGKINNGKKRYKKDITEIMVAHNIPYVAQASPYHWKDLMKKVRKAISIEGPAFLNVLSVCPRGWRIEEDRGIEITKLAVDTNFWPLYEVENGEYHINYIPKDKKPISAWLKSQGRFKHLFLEENIYIIEDIQKEIDKRWQNLLKKAGE